PRPRLFPYTTLFRSMIRVVLLGALKILRRVHRDPDALVAEAVQLSLRSERGERRLLVVAALRQTRERLVVEDVDACVHPVRESRSLAEAGDSIAVRELDDAELRDQRRDHYRRCGAALAMQVEQRIEVDVVQLVAVERVQRPGFLAVLRRIAKPAAAAERLRFSDRDDLRAEPGQLRAEDPVLPARATDDHALHPGTNELRHLVLGQRMADDRDERLRLSARGV